jgi:hypothetical protein
VNCFSLDLYGSSAFKSRYDIAMALSGVSLVYLILVILN